MKKLITIFCLFLSTNAFANVITVQPFSADSSATHMENFRSTVVTVINGNIAGGSGGTSSVNILANSVGEIEMADDANPRVRDSELFNITTDTIIGGAVSSQGTVIESGCIQATDSDLTADVSACVAYINGYRVSKAATAQTYANNSTTYLWLSDTGTYTQSTNPNSTVSNSALLSSVVTSAGAITTVTNMFTSRVPGLILPVQYRSGLIISKDTTATITVQPGSCEINSSMLSKTTITTLNLATASDWAGGSSLRAAATFAFVGMDASGNLKMHTTAPTHDNYGVSTTSGKKRYATWSSTVYRILGWFFMDGAQLVEVASNIKEFGISNTVQSNDTSTALAISSAGTYNPISRTRFYNSGGDVRTSCVISADVSTGMGMAFNQLDGSTEISGSDLSAYYPTGGALLITPANLDVIQQNVSEATRTYVIQAKSTSAGTYTQRRKIHIVEEV